MKSKVKVITALEETIPSIRSILDGEYARIADLSADEFEHLREYLRPFLKKNISQSSKPNQIEAIQKLFKKHYPPPASSALHHPTHLLIPPCIHPDLLDEAKVDPQNEFYIR